MKELVIEAKTENLPTVIEFIQSELDQADCPPKILRKMLLAAEELFVNIALYAYLPENGVATIRICVGDEITLVFEDSGKPYNPLEQATPDITAEANERDVGGLGIFMVRQMMDHIHYEFKDGKNCLTISKNMTNS